MRLEYQVAQKLHGASAPSSKRAHDLIDLQLIMANGGIDMELAIPKDKGPVNQVILMERIERGERVREFALEAQSGDGGWREIYKGSCIGHKHIVRFDKIAASRLRLSVSKSAATPLIRDFSAYCN